MHYPGFGNGDMPDPEEYADPFDKISAVVEALLTKKEFIRFGLVQDHGRPLGFRILARHPDRPEWSIIQNTNAYEVGFAATWDSFRDALWKEAPDARNGTLTHCVPGGRRHQERVSRWAPTARVDQPGQLGHGLSFHGAAWCP